MGWLLSFINHDMKKRNLKIIFPNSLSCFIKISNATKKYIELVFSRQ